MRYVRNRTPQTGIPPGRFSLHNAVESFVSWYDYDQPRPSLEQQPVLARVGSYRVLGERLGVGLRAAGLLPPSAIMSDFVDPFYRSFTLVGIRDVSLITSAATEISWS